MAGYDANDLKTATNSDAVGSLPVQSRAGH